MLLVVPPVSSVRILQDPFSCHVSSDLFNLRLFLHLSLYFMTLKLSMSPSILLIRIFPMINSVYSFLARIPPKGFFSLLTASYQKPPFTNLSHHCWCYLDATVKVVTSKVLYKFFILEINRHLVERCFEKLQISCLIVLLFTDCNIHYYSCLQQLLMWCLTSGDFL